ncbi:LVIVD repeat-containing protein [Nocardia huaxiensis]|uniref:LVIVD repeat-containing protein n=1 Tax=Nocardia huaxiensis TaxID=2755382 RepID=UPI001E3D7B4D|nr:hypothetical protein [Nocardia huaxiensis]UFS99765.1 hypothetical protein LPY97_18745 [Nocardia huaxiensis]
MSTRIRAVATAIAVALFAGTAPGATQAETFTATEIGSVSVPRANCGPGSSPENGLQGDVPAEERGNGRSRLGYSCNLFQIGGLQEQGGGVLSVTYDHCSYTSTFFPGNLLDPAAPGVHVLDVSDPANPVRTASLDEPAMLGGTWESLKVNKERKLLAATAVPVAMGTAYFSIYDISDCAHPRLLNPGVGTNLTMPLPFLSHEGGFSPDGNTYWASGVGPGVLSAIDVRDPANPRIIWQSVQALTEHGFGISPDGNTMFLSVQTGINILDISAVQRRDPYPAVPQLATYLWADGLFNQHSVPVTYDGRPYIFTPDEAGSGGVKILDVADPRNPRIVRTLKLEVNLPGNIDDQWRSAMGGSAYSYDSHYCAADRPNDPTALACSWGQAGIRVFDVRRLEDIREIAYYNPPAQTGKGAVLPNSPHGISSNLGLPLFALVPLVRDALQGRIDPNVLFGPRLNQTVFGDLSADWCLSPPEWHGSQLWTTCSDNGFMVLELDASVYSPPVDQDSTIGS